MTYDHHLFEDDLSRAGFGPDRYFDFGSVPTFVWPTLEPEALHGLAGDVVDAVSPFTEADPAALLVTVLCIFGNVAGARPHMHQGNADHPARLNVALVGQTAKSRKGTSLNVVLPLFEQSDRHWHANRVRSGFGSGEALVTAVADPDPDGDPDDDGFAVKDPRLLVVEGEFARILDVTRREGNVLSAIARDAWDGRRLECNTKHSRVTATGAHISVLAHVTADELRAKLDSTEIANGFGNRFLFVAARRSKRLPRGSRIPDATGGRLSDALADAVAEARLIKSMDFDPAGGAAWDRLYDELADDEPGGTVGALCARDEANCLRLAVAYALLDRSDTIGADHVAAARAVWRYCAATVRYVYADSTGNPVADRLLKALRRAGPAGLTGAEQHQALGGHIASEDLDDARLDLERRGLAETRREKTGGRDRIVTRARLLPGERSERTEQSSPDPPAGECERSEKSEQSPPGATADPLNSVSSLRSQVHEETDHAGRHRYDALGALAQAHLIDVPAPDDHERFRR